MNPIRFAIERPVTVSVGVLLIVLSGLISLGQIPIQLAPNLESTVVSVTTRWEGASPEQVEREVIRRQEEKLKGIPGLSKMFSTSSLGQGQITLEFELGTTKEAALREASDKLREVPEYPENVDEPIVEATNPADRDYIAWVVVHATDPAFDVRLLQDYFEERVKPRLERVPGIAEINVLGGLEREVHVRADPLRLAQRGVSPSAFLAALRAQNVDASAGEIAEGKVNIGIRAIGRYERLEDIEQTLISQAGDPPVRVEDVAEVSVGHKRAVRSVRNKGRNVLAMNAQREVGSNVIEVMERYKAALADVQEHMLPAEAERLGLDGEIVLDQVSDQTVYIHQAINLVRQNLFVGGTLAVLVLLAFFRSFRPTGVIALAIPVSIIGTFTAMTLMGRNLNVISLAGLAFAVGLVVDNAIVVLENIDRHRRMGQPPAVAALRGAREVWGAILASTLTTIAVFIPILTVQEEAGQLFRDIALAIVAAVALSLIVSITVIPSASARFLGGRRRRREEDEAAESGGDEEEVGRPSPGAPGSSGETPDPLRDPRPQGEPEPAATERPVSMPVARAIHRMGGWVIWPMRKLARAPGGFLHGISGLIYHLSGSWAARGLILAGFTAAALVGAYLLMPPASYLPQGNRNLVFAMIATPPSYNLAQQESVGLRMEDRFRPYWEAYENPELADSLPSFTVTDPITGESRVVSPPPAENFFFVAVPGMMFGGAVSADPVRVSPFSDLFNDSIAEIPALSGMAMQSPLFQTASRGAGDAIELEISGPDLEQVNAVASELLGVYRGHFGFGAVRPDPSNFDLPGPEVRVLPRHVHKTDLGLTQGDLNAAVQVFGEGAIIGDYLDRGEIIDLKVLGIDNQPGDATYLSQLPMATPAGHVVPLSSVAEVRRTVAPQQIARVEEQRAVTLQINLPEHHPLERAMDTIQGDIDRLRAEGLIPATVETNLAGSAARLRDVRRALLGDWTGFNRESLYALLTSRMFLALLVVFMVMAALFESWTYPLVIIFSVPLATVGGFLGLRLVHGFVPSQQLDVLTMLGFVILIGIVVNNAILLVHQALNLMRGEADVEVDGKVVSDPLPPREAIAMAVRTRVRPIFMSMMTSIGGMLPLVLFPGAGSELYRGLGSVVIGGLLVSTVFTLILVPLLLSVVFDLRRMTMGGRAQPQPAAA